MAQMRKARSSTVQWRGRRAGRGKEIAVQSAWADSGAVLQVDHVAAGLAGGCHGFLGKGKGCVLATEPEFAVDVEVPRPPLSYGTFQFDPDQFVAIAKQRLPHGGLGDFLLTLAGPPHRSPSQS